MDSVEVMGGDKNMAKLKPHKPLMRFSIEIKDVWRNNETVLFGGFDDFDGTTVSDDGSGTVCNLELSKIRCRLGGSYLVSK